MREAVGDLEVNGAARGAHADEFRDIAARVCRCHVLKSDETQDEFECAVGETREIGGRIVEVGHAVAVAVVVAGVAENLGGYVDSGYRREMAGESLREPTYPATEVECALEREPRDFRADHGERLIDLVSAGPEKIVDRPAIARLAGFGQHRPQRVGAREPIPVSANLPQAHCHGGQTDTPKAARGRARAGCRADLFLMGLREPTAVDEENDQERLQTYRDGEERALHGEILAGLCHVEIPRRVPEREQWAIVVGGEKHRPLATT